MSTPWMGREFEQDRSPTVRPWKAPLKLRMESFGEPGASCFRTVLNSSGVNSVLPPLLLCMYLNNYYVHLINIKMIRKTLQKDNVHLMNISLIPFSLLHVPHIIGNTWMRLMMTLCMMLTRRMTMIMLKTMMPLTWDVPGGATAIIELRIRINQSSEGNQPSAGLMTSTVMTMIIVMLSNLLAIARTFLSSRRASKIRGWL